MTKLIRYDKTCQLLDETSKETLEALDYNLSFKVKGVENSKRVKEGYINSRGEQVFWDGRTQLLKGNGRFSTGLLDRVIEFYELRGLDLEVIDRRTVISDPTPIDIMPVLKKQGKIPRDYQISAVNKASAVNRGIIRVPTGGGKTIIAALLTAKLGKSTIIYVIGKDLLYQIHKLFSSLFDEEIGIIGDGKCEIKRINVATIWSIGKCLDVKDIVMDDEASKEKEIAKEKRRDIKEMLLQTKVHLLDECHICACETMLAIAHNVKAEHFYGMSASPWRDDGADLLIESVLGRRVVDISAKYLIDNGYLVKPVIRFLAVPVYEGPANSAYKTVYKNYITINQERNEMIVKAATKLVEQGFRTLVLFHTKAHGKRLKEMLSKNVRCEILSGDDKFEIREKVCNKLEAGEIDCLIASKIFDIGIDIPSLSALVIGGGGKSSVRALQRVGRVIRPYKDKQIAPVIDFCDQAPYLSDHSVTRKEILETEFQVQWPQEKQKQ